MPLPLGEHGAVAMDENLIVIGGRNGKEHSKNVWKLDTSDKSARWIEKACMSDPRSLFGAKKIDDKIFVCGGFSNGWIISCVEMFDGKVWRKGPDLTHYRSSASSTIIPINFGKYLEYGITKCGRTKTKSNATYLRRKNETLTIKDIDIEKETILLLGGMSGKRALNTLLILQNNEENWKELNITLPYPIGRHGAQFLDNSLYIFGGQSKGNEALNCTYKLSNKLEWEKMADMNCEPSCISNSSVILNDRIWVLGGWNGKKTLKSVEMYDPSINEWEYMREMNEPRYDAAATVVNGKIFCCGGGNGKKLLNSTECYDPSSDVWTFISNMPLPLAALGAVAMDGNLIVMGGATVTEELRNVWALDTLNKHAEWIEKPSMALGRRFLSIAKIDNKIFVCGGESEEDTISHVEIFDGETWKNGLKLPTPRSYASAIVIPTDFAKYLN